MTDTLPVPPSIWKKLRELLADDRSADLTLHIRRRSVRGATVSRHLVVSEPRPDRRVVVSSRR